MNKKITLVLAATALYFIPAFSQVSTSHNNGNCIDSLAGFQADVAFMQSGEEQDPQCAANQLRLAKRQYIDQKYHLGYYSPEAEAARKSYVPPGVQTACSNVDFETGDFPPWSGAIGDNTISNAGPLQNIVNGFFTVGNDAPIGNSSARHTIITPAYGNDPYGGFPGVPPGSGNYTVRMGGETPNYQSEYMEQTFTVSPASTSFAYRYAVVLNDPQTGHVFTAKPYFKIEVLDQNGQPISVCTQYFVVADVSSLAGFTLSPVVPPTGGVVYYKPWTTVNFDLSGYVNQDITVRFTVGGCTQSGHFGYAYFDCSCSTFAANVNFCPGNNFLFLTAPSGYGTYQWFDPTHVAIPGATNDTLIVNNPVVGDTFFCYLVSDIDTSCHNILPVVLQYTQIYANPVSTDVTCFAYRDGTASANGSSGIPPYSYQWFTTPNLYTQSISGLGSGTYVVLVQDSMGCESYDTVTINSPARLDTSLFTYDYCYGDPHLTIYAPPGYTSYTWVGPNPTDTILLNSPLSFITLSNPQIGQQYLCILYDPPNCPIYDTVVLSFVPPLVIFSPDSTINVFTPNGDMKNDVFYPYYDYSIAQQTPTNTQPPYDFFDLHIGTFEIWIFDRWGNQVFYSNDYTIAWDGTIDKGKNCTDGVYFWVCKMTSKCIVGQDPFVTKGFVHLIR